jgi:hypothetical protein
MRALLSTLLILTISQTLNLTISSSPAMAAGDSTLAFRLKSTLQQLLIQKRELERDLDDTADEICRLERVRDFSSVARTLDDLQKKRRVEERRQQDILFAIKDIENDLRACQ